MSNLIGKTLGKVHIELFLAKGGMAEVYIGRHTTLHRSVAVKFLKADLQDEPDLRERFEREARAIAMLRHPNIVQVFDFDSVNGQPYLVMEYVPGVSLGAYLRELHSRNERLDLVQIQSLLTKVANALTYAHDNNVVHRDVKPANIMLTSRSNPIAADKPLPADVEPILTDFGLVRFTQSNIQTSTGVITGTPAYMSPEQARGDRVDKRTDVYSLGITVYEMLAGSVPFEADSTLSVLHKQIYDPPPPIKGLSKGVQDVIARSLTKDPEARFRTPLQFAEAFENALVETGEAATLRTNTLSRAKTITQEKLRAIGKKQKKKPVTPIVMGMLVTLVLIGVMITARFLFGGKDNLVTPTNGPALTANTPGETSPSTAVPEAEPVGLLRFQDGSAQADQVTFSSENLPKPPEGSQYEAWLIADDGETLFSIGNIQFDGEGRATLTFVDTEGRNLMTFYHGLQLSVEPNPDNSPNPSGDIAFSTALPSGGYSHVRHLLSAFSSTPNGTPFVRGLKTNAELLNELAQGMLASFTAGDQENVRLKAEQMLNIIAGILSDEHKDWNGNGITDNPSDGYGLLLNGTNSGYIQGTISHANLALSTADATENMLIHGEHVKVAAENVSVWTPQLRDQLIVILESSSPSDAESAVRQAVVLANQILNGVDTNGNENIEAIPGEGGATTAYDHSYYMADILLFEP